MLGRAGVILVGLALACRSDPPPPAAPPTPRRDPAPVAPAATDLATRARRIVEQIARRELVTVVAGFDAKMRAAMPEAKLAATWDAITALHGKLVAIEHTDVQKVGDYQVVIVTCKLEQAKVGIKLAFDATDHVAGFFVVPPQEPYVDPPYVDRAKLTERDVTVGTGDFALPGTLTVPAGPGPVPAVVLVHGSGPGDRDETVAARKPFRDLAGGLATRGIAVLRYDKRTHVHAARAVARLDTFTVDDEVVDDAVAAVELLAATPGIDPKRIVVAGHSLGGQLAPRIATRSPAIRAIAILAGSTRPIADMMIEQLQYIAAADGTESPEEAAQIAAVVAARQRIAAIIKGAPARPGENVLGAGAAYHKDLATYDAPATARKLARPIFVAQGGRDYQVTAVDFATWKKALAARKDVAFHLYPELDHALGAGTGKSGPDDYQRRAPVDLRVVEDLAAWVSRL